MTGGPPGGQKSPIVYSVVIPVYKNEGSLPTVVERLGEMQGRLDGPLEAVFVVDGSPDNSLAILRQLLPEASIRSQLIAHSRNFGSFPAIKAGFAAARGDYVAAMAADLQEPIELIEEFFGCLASGEWDVAVGTREAREDPLVSRTLSRTYWSSYRRLVQPDMPAGGVDIFATTRAVARKLVSLDESHSSLVGLLFWLGYRRIEIPYSRQERVHGKSAWSMRKKVNYLLDSVFSFTSMPITVILALGLTGSLLSVVAAFWVFVSWLVGSVPVQGYTALMLVLLFSTGGVLFAIGVLGTYVWRTYENTKNRPSSVVMSTEVFHDDDA
ncbi:glycosyltransferase family 2 protein [Klugiella xanthotipulae]|uniref:Glycosyltransferase involved in cell wall biosynthesis n=1 Tax=Klugiella xanthotipulae TaxID=244735 RepID=A0A543HH25_9MICO|nr:glycosyltransferase family 2 protein [Klugiella xanthotipulae]TQM57589.1 glycosyltransferase involved in cell wall biosynthesis [Klugiella xanthotipulae]